MFKKGDLVSRVALQDIYKLGYVVMGPWNISEVLTVLEQSYGNCKLLDSNGAIIMLRDVLLKKVL